MPTVKPIVYVPEGAAGFLNRLTLRTVLRLAWLASATALITTGHGDWVLLLVLLAFGGFGDG